ncbi:MAG TPA: DNA polymerase III subunit [Phycisphaerae bacterium]|nr:DNA polymerase III subunit [Phycisphaerae bacterium]
MLNVQAQSRAISQLQRALLSGRLASTWMFAGPAGVGKFKLAVELARTVLCDHPQHRPNNGAVPQLPPEFPLTLPCGTCESCRAIDANNHPDLHIVTKELIRYHDKTGKSKGTTLSIDVIRGEITGDPTENKEAKIYKRSFRGKGKFFLIDEADLMEAPAQNALLKTLEEPPAESYLILITTSPQELLSTIRSRAQLVTFNELPDEVITHALIEQGMNSDDAALLARLARGSLGRALLWAGNIKLIDQKNNAAAERAAKKAAAADEEDEDGPSTNKFTPGGILAWAHELGGALDQLVAGRMAASEVATLIAKFAAEFSDLHLLHDKLASADRAKRDGIALMMTIAAEWFADRLRHALGTPHPTLLPGITGALDYALIPRLIATARAAEAEIDMNANDKILLAATTTIWEQLLHEGAA